MPGKLTTNIPVVIVPLIVTAAGVTLDPTVVLPGCCAYPASWNGLTPIQLTAQSPVFTPSAANWTMNGQNIGAGQYIDAFRRAEYWSLVGGSSYHTVLSPVTVAAAVTVPASAIDTSATTAASACLGAGSPADQIILGNPGSGVFCPLA